MNAAPNSDAPVWRHVNFRRFWLVRIGSMGTGAPGPECA